MNDQVLDLRKYARIVWRHKRIVGVAALLGLLVGVAFTLLRPPLLTSRALVVLPPPATKFIGTQVVIAGSTPVLERALPRVDPPVSLTTLRNRVQAGSLTPSVIAISAQGTTAAQAEGTANAVAASYIAYVRSPGSPVGPVRVQVLQGATSATGTPLVVRMAVLGGVGALLGALVGAVVALAVGRGDRRLRERDQIADAIGVPVVASVPVVHPSDAAGWAGLLGGYQPGPVEAWSLRKALLHLGLADAREPGGASVAVLSLASDGGALALGPQLAVYAASLGISTALVIGPQQDARATAVLRAGCAALAGGRSQWPERLQVAVLDHGGGPVPEAALSVVVAAVDGEGPQVAETMYTSVTVLGVSAGVATAEQLARVAASAAADGRTIAGILVADPDSSDHTTGRLPQLARPGHRRPAHAMADGRW
jgi:capsular polysaccharide biosynthesis protein